MAWNIQNIVRNLEKLRDSGIFGQDPQGNPVGIGVIQPKNDPYAGHGIKGLFARVGDTASEVGRQAGKAAEAAWLGPQGMQEKQAKAMSGRSGLATDALRMAGHYPQSNALGDYPPVAGPLASIAPAAVPQTATPTTTSQQQTPPVGQQAVQTTPPSVQQAMQTGQTAPGQQENVTDTISALRERFRQLPSYQNQTPAPGGKTGIFQGGREWMLGRPTMKESDARADADRLITAGVPADDVYEQVIGGYNAEPSTQLDPKTGAAYGLGFNPDKTSYVVGSQQDPRVIAAFRRESYSNAYSDVATGSKWTNIKRENMADWNVPLREKMQAEKRTALIGEELKKENPNFEYVRFLEGQQLEAQKKAEMAKYERQLRLAPGGSGEKAKFEKALRARMNEKYADLQNQFDKAQEDRIKIYAIDQNVKAVQANAEIARQAGIIQGANEARAEQVALDAQKVAIAEKLSKIYGIGEDSDANKNIRSHLDVLEVAKKTGDKNMAPIAAWYDSLNTDQKVDAQLMLSKGTPGDMQAQLDKWQEVYNFFANAS